MQKIELTKEQKSYMDRLGRLSGRSAASSLSQIMGRKVNIRLSNIFFIPLEDIQFLLGNPATVVVGIHHELMTDIQGSLLTLMPLELARQQLSYMLKTEIDDSIMLSSLGQSSLGELSNMLCGSYVSTISNLLKVIIIPSVPNVTIDMMGALTQDIILKLGMDTQQALIIKTELLVADDVINIHLLLLLEQSSFDVLMGRIDTKLGN